MDDLPVWGFVGPPPEESPGDEDVYIWTHKLLRINYNDNRVGPALLCQHAGFAVQTFTLKLKLCKL